MIDAIVSSLFGGVIAGLCVGACLLAFARWEDGHD